MNQKILLAAVLLIVAGGVGFAVWKMRTADDGASLVNPEIGAPESREGDALKGPGKLEVQATEARRGPVVSPTRWSLKGLGEVLGIVREYGTDKAVAAAEVALEAPEPGPGKVLVVKTNADGSFRFERVPNFHDWKLRIAPRPPLDGIDTGGIEVVENVATDLGILYLPPKFRVSGIVMDARGKGVEGALVRAVRRKTESSMMGFNFMKLIRELPEEPGSVDEARTTADGTFTLAKTPPGSYDLLLSAKGFEARVEYDVVITPEAAARPIKLTLTNGHTLAGRVVRKDGGSPAGVRIIAFRQDERAMMGGGTMSRVIVSTDEKGEFTIDGLGAGRCVVVAAIEGMPLKGMNDEIQIPATTFTQIVIEGDARLEGVVTDRRQKPVEGASVTIIGDMKPPMLACVMTDANGRYSVGGLGVGKLQFFIVQAETFAPFTGIEDMAKMFSGMRRGGPDSKVEIKPGRNEKNVVLEDGGIVSGRVTAKGGTEPVAGAKITVTNMLAMFGGARSATTDADGRYTINALPKGPALVTVAKDGFHQDDVDPQGLMGMFMGGGKKKDSEAAKPGRIEIAEYGQKVECNIEIGKVGAIAGKVVDPDGKPVAGAQVQVSSEERGRGFFPMEMFGGAKNEKRFTDAEGRFEISGPEQGKNAVVVATARGYVEGRSESIVGTGGELTKDIVVALRKGATIEGKVVDQDNKPVAGAMLRWTLVKGEDGKDGGGEDWETAMRLRTAAPTATLEDGSFVIREVSPGKLRVRAQATGYLPGDKEDLMVAEGGSTRCDMTIQKGMTLAGKVALPDGAPAVGARVHASRQWEKDEKQNYARDWESTNFNVDVKPDGSFEIKAMIDGRYEVTASLDDYAPSTPETVPAGSSGLVLVLRKALAIKGVVLSRGVPVADLAIRAVHESDKNENNLNEETDSEGRFLFDNVPEGLYTVEAGSDSWRNDRPNVIAKSVTGIVAGTDNIVIELEPGLTISGTVTDDGKPAGNGWVNGNLEIVSTDGKELDNAEIKRRSRHASGVVADGAFELVGLEPGNYNVTVSIGDGRSRSFKAKAGDANIKVAFGDGGTVRGRLVMPNGGAAQRAWVSIMAEDSGSQLAGGNTDENGYFEMKDVPPGKFKVWATISTDDDKWLSADGTGSIEKGGNVDVGTLTVKENGGKE